MTEHQEKLFNMLFNENEITWKTIILDLVKKEGMDPWDIDIGLLAQRFIEMVRKLKEMDFKISGKIILAAAILLRIKSTRLVGEDLNELDRLIAMSDQDGESEFYDELEQSYQQQRVKPEEDMLTLIPRTPQPRKRKVSVYDLVNALNKALEVKKRRRLRMPDIQIEIPEKKIDITKVISDVYKDIRDYFLVKKGQKLTFSQLVKSDKKEDKIYTFIPLLHLDNQRKIDLTQKEHLGEIGIYLNKEADGKLDLSNVE